MTILDQWDHTWFGFWREFGPRFEDCPSAYDFVFPDVVATYDKERLRKYLTNAQLLAITSRRNFPSPFTREQIGGSIASMTDGEWYWMNDLPDYIEQFNIAIPTAWLQKIIARNYVPPPPVDMDVIATLERPPTK